MNQITEGEVGAAIQEVFFEKGLPGFLHLTRFIVDQADPEAPLAVLQSIEDEQVWFLIGNPLAFFPDYEFELSVDTKEELGIGEDPYLAVWGIITYRGSINLSTMNLQAPLVIHMNNSKGKQIILNDPRYSIRQSIMPDAGQEVAPHAGS